MEREEVYKLINTEVDYAEKRGKGNENYADDSKKQIETWILYMEEYLHLARKDCLKSLDKTYALENIRKIAALAVACMQHNETPSRKPLQWGGPK
jgi:hypothetical protein